MKNNRLVEDVDKLCWEDEAWNKAGDRYIEIYNEIAENLPLEKRHLLLNLEMIEMEQSQRMITLIEEHMIK